MINSIIEQRVTRLQTSAGAHAIINAIDYWHPSIWSLKFSRLTCELVFLRSDLLLRLGLLPGYHGRSIFQLLFRLLAQIGDVGKQFGVSFLSIVLVLVVDLVEFLVEARRESAADELQSYLLLEICFIFGHRLFKLFN